MDTKAFDVDKFRKQVEDRLATEKANRANPHFCSTDKERYELDGYIRCLQNILFILPTK